jgi:hypothetical protein
VSRRVSLSKPENGALTGLVTQAEVLRPVRLPSTMLQRSLEVTSVQDPFRAHPWACPRPWIQSPELRKRTPECFR